MYYSPFSPGSHELSDGGGVGTIYSSSYATNAFCGDPSPGNDKEHEVAGGRPISTLAGWSLGRRGPIYYLKDASDAEKLALNYVLLIDPGYWGQMGCDRIQHAGDALANWLIANPSAHLVVISGSAISQQGNSQGIQETYFNAIRNQSTTVRNLRPRVLTCNYGGPIWYPLFGPSPLDSNPFTHEEAFRTAQYWIKHEIGVDGCPWMRDAGRTWYPTAWHP